MGVAIPVLHASAENDHMRYRQPACTVFVIYVTTRLIARREGVA